MSPVGAPGVHGLRTGRPEPAAGGAAGDVRRVRVRGLGRRRGVAGRAGLDVPRARGWPLADGVGPRRAGCAARRRRIRTRPTVTSQGTTDRERLGCLELPPIGVGVPLYE